MGRDTKTYKGNKKDQYTIVLEEIRDQFGLFGEALQFTNQNLSELRSDFERMNRKMDFMSLDIREMKTILNKHDDKLDNHEERIGRLENS